MKNLRIFMIAAVAATFAMTQGVAQEKRRITESITIIDDDAEVEDSLVNSVKQNTKPGGKKPIARFYDDDGTLVEITNIENVVVEEGKGTKGTVWDRFSGGPQALMGYIYQNLQYPSAAVEQGVEGLVGVQFAVDKDGSVVEPRIIRSLNPLCDKEALRVIKTLPKWKKGKSKDYVTLPVKFKLDNKVVERKTIPAKGNSIKAAFEALGTPAKKVEVMPEFVGGEEAMMQFLTSQADYAEIEEASKSFGQQYIIKFFVGADGKLRDCSILRGIPTEMAEKALNIVKAMPAWKPGTVNGEPKDMLYAVALPFKMTKKPATPATPATPENAGNANQEVKSEEVAEKPAEETVVEDSMLIEITDIEDVVIEEIPDPDSNEIYQVVETMPEFPGGVAELMKWLSKNVKYPTEALEKGAQGRVIVQFTVNKDGSIVDPIVSRGVHSLLDAEAIRVVKSMPKWKPGTQRGVPVRVKFTMPIGFILQ